MKATIKVDNLPSAPEPTRAFTRDLDKEEYLRKRELAEARNQRLNAGRIKKGDNDAACN